MGYPMAGHLSKNQDFDIYVYNRTEAVSDKWLSEYKGLKFNLTDSNNIQFNGLITCLKNDEAIVDLLLKKRLISCLNKNSFVLDHSTTSLNLIELITSDKCVIKNNISFFDAPVSGGEAGAINGVLSVMFGGPKNKVSTIKKIMNAYSQSIVHIGPSGHGQLTKMVNQIPGSDPCSGFDCATTAELYRASVLLGFGDKVVHFGNRRSWLEPYSGIWWNGFLWSCRILGTRGICGGDTCASLALWRNGCDRDNQWVRSIWTGTVGFRYFCPADRTNLFKGQRCLFHYDHYGLCTNGVLPVHIYR